MCPARKDEIKHCHRCWYWQRGTCAYGWTPETGWLELWHETKGERDDPLGDFAMDCVQFIYHQQVPLKERF